MTNLETIELRKQIINTYKVINGCCVCGYNSNPSALCFDHVSDDIKHEDTKNGYSKRSSAGGMFKLYSKRYSSDDIINEIKKCRILCCNCHMEHTHKPAKYIDNKIDTIEKLSIELSKTDGI